MKHRRRGLTPIELIIVFTVLPILIGILFPSLAKARDSAKLTQSINNLRQLAVASFTYTVEWRDRQYQAVPDNLTQFGDSLQSAVLGYEAAIDEPLTIWLGWTSEEEFYQLLARPGNESIMMPMTFDAEPFGYARIPNARAISQYLSFTFYDRVFYAPKDIAVLKCVEPLFDDPNEFVHQDKAGGLYWSSYCFSPAALIDPRVLAGPSKGGFVDPFTLPEGLRAPGIDQTMYPDLKTHIMEHNWLQNNRAGECNPAFGAGTYKGCEPYYFNHSLKSEPLASFYDGHVEKISNARVYEADKRLRDAGQDGLWLRQPGGATTGYYEDTAFEPIKMSYHMFTCDGIKGRDVLPR